MSILLAVFPVCTIIFIGYFCRKYTFVDEGFWRGAEKFAYYLLFPALLVSKMSVADIGQLDFVKTALVVVAMLISLSICLLCIKPVTNLSNPAFTSVFQGGVRFNAYIGFALVAALYGEEGLVVAVVIAAMMIPLINLLCISVLEYYRAAQTGFSGRRLLLSIIRNPLIVACVVGIGINLSGLILPQVVVITLEIFSSAALPIGLLTVGAALKIRSVLPAAKPILLASLAKFIALPFIAYGFALVFALTPETRHIIIAMTVLPTATASYVLAKQLDGDAELMAVIVTAQTLLAIVTMPLVLLLLS